VLEAIGLRLGLDRSWDTVFNAYFQGREQWIQLSLDALAVRHHAGEIGDDDFRVQRAALELREWALTSSDSFEDRLGLMAEWDHELQGDRVQVRGEELLGGIVDREAPWNLKFWMGGFDGDLHRGYLRGTLAVPFRPPG
jgi:hypothetical protein